MAEAGSDGKVTFQSIFPACYTGRWPHVHFEVYPNLAKAIDAGNRLATSQIALPKSICDAVYATSGYEASVGNLSGLSLNTDMVFRDDGAAHQLGHDGRYPRRRPDRGLECAREHVIRWLRPNVGKWNTRLQTLPLTGFGEIGNR